MRAKSTWVVATLFMAGIPAYAVFASATDVTVDGAERYQTVEGFGTCLIAWVERFRTLYRTEDFQRLYVEGVGCNMLRVNMWGPIFEKPTEDWTKIRCEDFDMGANGGRPQIFIDFGRGIRKLDPNIKIIGTVWSPPAWMKVNRSITDTKSSAIRAGGYGNNNNRVDPEYFPHFCQWMVEYVRLHDRQGVPFYAVSPGNEVQFSQSFESCVWDGRDFAVIVVMLRERLDAEGYGHVKIFGPETMTSHLYEGGTGSYVKAVRDNPQALKALDVFATHGYEDGVKAEMSATSSRRFWELIADTGKPFWITEGGTGDHDWPAPIQKGVGNALHNALVAGNCSAFVPWQITESRKSIHALMVMSTYTPKTYTAMHYTKFIRPGARRIDARPGFGAVQLGAFLHKKDGDLAIVALNPSDQEQTLSLTFRNLEGLASLKVYRTSASESLAEVDEVAVAGDKTVFPMVPQSIVTFSGKVSRTRPPAARSRQAAEVADFDRQRIFRLAEEALSTAPISITRFPAPLSAGGPHDFYSNGDYWWPDPNEPDGLPYVRRDGQSNPENFSAHRIALRNMRDAVAALAAAYALDGQEKYAEKAVALLKVFFLDEATRMDPSLLYAQAIPGRVTGRGIGIIDTLHLAEVAPAIAALDQSRAMTPEIRAGLKQWFRDYSEWMTTHRYGVDEMNAKNNHSVAYMVQLAAFARLTGDVQKLELCRTRYKEVFVPQQMALDGSFPQELRRTKPYGYSIFQLDNMAILCQLLSTREDDLWTFTLPDGRGIRKAVEYLYPYLRDKSKWPHRPDVEHFEAWPVRQPALLFAACAFGENKYLNLWKTLDPDPSDPEVRRNMAITQPLLWLN